MKKLIIAGSRTINVTPHFITTIMEQFQIKIPLEIVSGGAWGIDNSGEKWANTFYLSKIKLSRFPADWETHGKAAGRIRNKQMADYSDALLLIWDGVSKGSSNMRQEMLKLNKPVYEVILRNENAVL
jgi:hypothetical protein